ncbi:MAG: ATP-binding protein [Lactobacillaceae bacterium]|jgi:predicted AAA+ superfamily ATPase|nr:ATP-binding protein [Lactobacillaceae bacterium]
MDNKYVRREQYLDFLHRWREKDMIKVLSGVRRAGKSTLLELFKRDLREDGVLPQNIISINFELIEFEELTDYHKLHEYVLARVDETTMNYVFLDEIQHVEQFERAVDSLYIRDYIDLYITGSNAFFLSGELATLLTGRYVEQQILPLSFKEFKTWQQNHSVTGEAINDRDLYEMYTTSSFPYTLTIDNPTDKYAYLQAVFTTIVYKDVIQRLNAKDPDTLERIAKYLASATGTPISFNKIKNTFVSAGNKISFETIKRYVGGLQEGLLFYSARQFKIRGRQLLQNLDKYYLVDVGLRQILLPDANEDQGHILENVIYLELIRRGYKVFVGKIDDLEVDFVAVDRNQNLKYFQVSLNTLDENTLARELRSLQKINDTYPKYLLTMDTFGKTANYDGIIKMSALDWLQGE